MKQGHCHCGWWHLVSKPHNYDARAKNPHQQTLIVAGNGLGSRFYIDFFALHNKLDTIVTTAQLHKKQTTQGQSKFIAVVVDGI